ncbi:MAG: phosphatidate cytidylyltransferase, partial [Acidimicrobiales bacterium]
ARSRIPAPPPPEEGITVVGSTPLPHWTDPPTGEVPIAIADLGGDDDESDVDAGVRWRSSHDNWADGPDVEGLAGDDVLMGALQDRSEEAAMFSFDEAFERLEEERSGPHPAVPFDDLGEGGPIRVGGRAANATTTIPRSPAGIRRRPLPGAGRVGALGRHDDDRSSPPDLASRIAVGVGLALLVIAAYAVGAKALLALTAIALVAAAGEAFNMLRRSSGFRPATLIGLLATTGLVLGAWWKGVDALPLVMAVTVAATMLWYLLGVSDARPLANVMATLTTVAWVGFLGSFGALLLRAPHGKGLFFTAVVTAAVADVVAYFGGRAFGSHRLAPNISPGKTVEGLAAGAVAALAAGAVLGHVLQGWGGFEHGVLLGVVVAVFAPIGDLFESLIKRDLDVKDSGHTLAGHGGLLDRFDSLLLVLPASYYLAVALRLA